MRYHRKQLSLSWKEHFHISLIVTILEGFLVGYLFGINKMVAKKTKDKMFLGLVKSIQKKKKKKIEKLVYTEQYI